MAAPGKKTRWYATMLGPESRIPFWVFSLSQRLGRIVASVVCHHRQSFLEVVKRSPPQGTWARWHLHLRSSPIQFFPFSLVGCKEIRFSSQLLRAFQKIYKVVLPQISLSALQQSFNTFPWEASNTMHVPNRKLHPIREIRNR